MDRRMIQDAAFPKCPIRNTLPHLDSLIGWAIENFDAILADRKSGAQ